ncbi:MAG TPA: ribose 5-phosphate isomerase B [Bryobacteraceae bacterium]|nr:ribose 5-phosphate isomerase B [Bryobacteraceae bacterium]HPT26954.1 ribose 5-phosphate isomerase B [Bryobacteraceae bacterium]
MRIAIGSDHAGFALKEQLRDRLESAGFEVADLGTNSPESTDYPDYAAAVAHQVVAGKAERGVLVCYTGVGMSIAANKVHGIRAALCMNPDQARLTRAHNNSNVLTLGAKYTPYELAGEIVDTFLTTEFEGGRHARRVGKITSIEEGKS